MSLKGIEAGIQFLSTQRGATTPHGDRLPPQYSRSNHGSDRLPDVSTQREVIPLSSFIQEFGKGLISAVQRQNPPIYDGVADTARTQLMEGLLRKPFDKQQDVVQAASRYLIDENEPAVIINAEMGTGKTMMAIAAAAVMHEEGYPRTLVISPPHLVYKWRREIKQTIPNARVWILNGPDTLRKLLQLRELREKPTVPEFFVLGRVRMRMGFNWEPAFTIRKALAGEGDGKQVKTYAACPGAVNCWWMKRVIPYPRSLAQAKLNHTRSSCTRRLTVKRVIEEGVVESTKPCGERLWTLVSRNGVAKSRRDLIMDSLQGIPTIGGKTATKLVDTFGEDMLSGMLEDNVYEFINLMDDEGDLFFNDRQARRMERAMANTEFSFGQGGYQATEFIKRYLPQGYFSLLVVDEGHD